MVTEECVAKWRGKCCGDCTTLRSQSISAHSYRQHLLVHFVLLLVACSLMLPLAHARIHTLDIKDDSRSQFILSTFGFLSGGYLEVHLKNFTISPPLTEDERGGSHTGDTDTVTPPLLYGLTLDKSSSDGMSSYLESHQTDCILNHRREITDDDAIPVIFFTFNLNNNRVDIERHGKDLSGMFLIDKLAAGAGGGSAGVAGEKAATGGARRKRAPPPLEALEAQPADTNEGGTEGKTDDNQDTPQTKDNQHTPQTKDNQDTPQTKDNHHGTETDDNHNGQETSDKPGIATESSGAGGSVMSFDDSLLLLTTSSGEGGDGCKLGVDPDCQGELYFRVNIESTAQEGLYNLYFHNCRNYNSKQQPSTVNFTLSLQEENLGSFLSAGDIPLPTLYFVLAALFFIMAGVWLMVLRKARDDVYKIHYLMLALVYVKSLSLLFHSINYHFIGKDGHAIETWAVLYYVIHLLKGALLFITIILIGAGWTFIKHVLSDKDKKIFMIVIPLQVLDNIAQIIIEETEEGDIQYSTWKEVFILVDLLCCGAILFPIVWSIRHLQEASGTDGKAAISLVKLKLFRHFYIMIVCYIYFTRIIVYLLKITVPFEYEWLDETFKEAATVIFFIFTGYKFRPASDNPYLQVSQDDEDDDDTIEMDEVLTESGVTSGVTSRVGKVGVSESGERGEQGESLTQSAVSKRESSHEYD